MRKLLLIAVMLTILILVPKRAVAQDSTTICPALVSFTVSASGSLTIPASSNYYIYLAQHADGLRSAGADLPVLPDFVLVAGTNAVIQNVTSSSQIGYYCYYLNEFATPTATATATVTPAGTWSPATPGGGGGSWGGGGGGGPWGGNGGGGSWGNGGGGGSWGGGGGSGYWGTIELTYDPAYACGTGSYSWHMEPGNGIHIVSDTNVHWGAADDNAIYALPLDGYLSTSVPYVSNAILATNELDGSNDVTTSYGDTTLYGCFVPVLTPTVTPTGGCSLASLPSQYPQTGWNLLIAEPFSAPQEWSLLLPAPTQADGFYIEIRNYVYTEPNHGGPLAYFTGSFTRNIPNSNFGFKSTLSDYLPGYPDDEFGLRFNVNYGTAAGDICIYLHLANAPTSTPVTGTLSPTIVPATSTITMTPRPTRTPTQTRTATAVRTATATATATASATVTPTPVGLPCAVAQRIPIPVAPDNTTIEFTLGQQFVVQDADIYINVGATARQIRAATNYTWSVDSGTYTAYSLTTTASLWLCDLASTATATRTATITTETSIAVTWTPGTGWTAPTAAVCVGISPTATVANYAMPNLALIIPSRQTTAALTVTIQISTTALVSFQKTVEAGIQTPAAAVATTSANYSWSAGAGLAATNSAILQPGLAWVAVLNPKNPAWLVEGGPLWAVEPAIAPILPIVSMFFLVAITRLILWLAKWILILIDLVIKLIELFPGM